LITREIKIYFILEFEGSLHFLFKREGIEEISVGQEESLTSLLPENVNQS